MNKKKYSQIRKRHQELQEENYKDNLPNNFGTYLIYTTLQKEFKLNTNEVEEYATIWLKEISKKEKLINFRKTLNSVLRGIFRYYWFITLFSGMFAFPIILASRDIISDQLSTYLSYMNYGVTLFSFFLYEKMIRNKDS